MEQPPTLARLLSYFKRLRVITCAVYQVFGTSEAMTLRLQCTWSPFAKTREQHREVGKWLEDHVLRCCELNCNQVQAPDPGLRPDANGRRPWNLVIGAGAVRKAGYAIGAAALATDEAEAKDCVLKIESLFANGE